VTPTPRDSVWSGLLVAITTPFSSEFEIDHTAFAAHALWLASHGADAIIVGGSLGEGSSLSSDERTGLVNDLVGVLPQDVPVLAAVAASRTQEAVAQARRAASAGARGLLVLPPYVYRGDRAETSAHFAEVFRATDVPCMLYNNPPAYGVDVDPDQVAELAAEHPTLRAVKESSGDVPRIAALVSRLGGRLDVAVGLDESIDGGLRAGATGWVAGLANALPDESVALFRAGRSGDFDRCGALYRWFLPLLRMDTGSKFVQRIKLVQSEAGHGHPRVRLPRLELRGSEREETLATFRECLAHRPEVPKGSRL
jgi:1-pyrroline-4-hydroxy-2-carboxylate deaminase